MTEFTSSRSTPRLVARLLTLLLVLSWGAPALAAVVTRGPYLQRGDQDSVVVRWRTDVPTKSRVFYGTDPGDLGDDVKNSASVIDHELLLENLTPDTRYYYTVGTFTEILAGGDLDHFFETAPIPGTPTPTRVWVLGDSGTADANAMAVRDAYYAFTGAQHTDLWLMLGDNAYPNGTDADYQSALFDIYPEMLRKSVLWPTIGNHDAFSSDSSSQSGPYFDLFTLPSTGEAGGTPSGTEAYYSFDFANIHFVVLDSHGSSRLPDGPMLTWLANDLASTTQEWLIAYWHHPPYSKGSHDSDDPVLEQRLIDMRQFALPILEDHGVDLVLTGHSHSFERSFLIDGHYGFSDTFGPEHVVDGGDGREDGDGAYGKPPLSGVPHQGTVYVVAGNGGQTTGGPLDHPVMYVSYNLLGSVVLNFDGDRLDATFLDWNTVERDSFTILKDPDLLADFVAEPRVGDAPHAVGFTDLSIGATQWAWDFDDDGQVDSTLQNPTHVYAQPGVYSVRLTVDGAGGVHEEFKSDYIQVDLGVPIADFTATPLNGLVPLTVAFTDLSAQLPDQWAWDFENDGQVDSVEQHPIHTYTMPGSYSVRLAAANAAGSDEIVKLGHVTVIPYVPSEITGLVFESDRSTISWDAHPQACAYDMVRGDLNLLVSSGGDFDSSRLGCDAEDVFQAQATSAADPGLDQAWYYLVRGVDCAFQAGSYDTSGIRQAASRDPGLQGVGASCTCQAVDDPDGDAYCNALDNCPDVSNADQLDPDGDGFGDACDNCPSIENVDQADLDADNLGDVCDSDDDGDGIDDIVDLCPFDFDNDLDGDGVCGDADNCPDLANTDQLDTDVDGLGDVCDCAALNPYCTTDCTDVDLDGFCVTSDCDDAAGDTFPGAAPADSPESCMKDSDGDGWGDDAPPTGVIAGTDCDDTNAAVSPDTLWYADSDADGFGDPGAAQAACTQPAGHVADSSDCDDTSPTAAATFPGAAPEDDPAACMKDVDGDGWGDTQPPAGVASGSDCDDDDAGTNPTTIWYADLDGDGFGDPGVTQAACTQPAAHVADSTDCDDTSPGAASTFPGAAPEDDPAACMKDVDDDGWGDDAPPAGVIAGTDCDDTNAAVNPDLIWYADADADGFGDGATALASCAQPLEYVLDATDCDDSSATASSTFPGAAPNDDAGACMKDVDGDGWGDLTPPAGVTPGSDCDDDDDVLNPETVWYQDNDGDGFGVTETSLVSCTQPDGYVLQDGDCRENGSGAEFIFPGAAPKDDPVACMKDVDGDDWGDDSPPGQVAAGTDCDDTDAALNAETLWYADSDGDGFGDVDLSQAQCLQPSGFVADATDCDDTSGSAAATFPGAAPSDDPAACMRDLDGDGWGDDTPAPEVAAGSDCDDAMNRTFPGSAPNDDAQACMKDVDLDGWGDAAPPAGVTAGTDCNDSSAATFPGAAPSDDPAACMKDLDGDDWGDGSPPAGVTAGSDCDDSSSSAAATFPGAAPEDDPVACMKDVDGDDWGDDVPPVGVTAGSDCDDSNAATSPDTLWYADDDADGFGDPGVAQASCLQPAGHVADSTDCDDTSPGAAATFPGAAPEDDPVACMRDVDGDDWGDDAPPAGVTAGSDCDDTDAATSPDTLWYADDDADGFGDPGVAQAACVQPAGYVADSDDCDDTSPSAAATFPGAAPQDDPVACMKDVDGDDWGDDAPPVGVTAGSDCDDSDAATSPDTLWYADDDADGFGDPGMTQASCLQPAGYVADSTDCDDAMDRTFPGAAPNDDVGACMKDLDQDGWGDATPPAGVTAGTDCDDGSATTSPGAAPEDDPVACMKDVDGDDWGDDTPPAGVTAGSDCDDSDAATSPDTLWYADDDGDGFGDPGVTQAACVQPAGYVADSDDCDDTSPGAAATFPGAAPQDDPAACMKDVDGDDWGDDAPPAGVTAGSDCDDSDAATSPDTLWYADDDADGFGDPGVAQTACVQPAGYVADSDDCDDTSPSAAATFPGAAPQDDPVACMKDVDGDDWGDDTPPAGVTAGTDCDDSDAATSPDTLWYADDDADGFGDPGETQVACAQPAGYVADSTDCDDSADRTFPGSAPNDDVGACMKDVDEDGWGDATPPAGVTAGTDCDDGSAVTFPGAAPEDDPVACMKDADGDDWGDDTPPAGVTAGTDCDDGDAATSPDTLWYLDNDADSFGDPGVTQAACVQPAGYVADSTDCDDTSPGAAATFPGAAPEDDPAACMKDVDGDDWGDDSPPAGVTAGTDCDDTDTETNPDTRWSADSDADGFGDPGVIQAACTQPFGYVADRTDCDDTSPSAAATFPGAAPEDDPAACMKDVDGDDWGDDTPPAGVTAGTDCDDTDAATNPLAGC